MDETQSGALPNFDSLKEDASNSAPSLPETGMMPTENQQIPQSLPNFDSLPDDDEKYGTPGQLVKTFMEGAGQGLVGPVAPATERALGVEPQDIRLRAETNPIAHVTGEVAGLVLPAVVSAGESVAARTGMEALVSKLGKFTVAGAMEKAAGFIPAAGETLASKVGTGAARGFIENMLLAGSDEASKMILQDPNQSAETAAIAIGGAGLLGAIAGGGTSAVVPLWNAKFGSKLGQIAADMRGEMAFQMAHPDHVGALTDELKELYGSYYKLAKIDNFTNKDIDQFDKAYEAFEPHLEQFEKNFTTKVPNADSGELEGTINPGKVNTFINQLGKPNAEIKQSSLENFIKAGDRFKVEVNSLYSRLGLEEPFKPTSTAAINHALETPTLGSKMAQWLINKGLTEAGATSLGAGAGEMLGSSIGVPKGIGAIIGAQALGPFFKSVLPGIAKSIVTKDPNALALKSSIDYAAAVAKGSDLLSKAAKNVFRIESEVLPKSLIPDDKDHDKIIKSLGELQRNPSAAYDQSAALSHYLPEHSDSLAQLSSKMATILTDMKASSVKKAPLDGAVVLSNVQKSVLRKATQIAQQPLLILKQIKDGTVTTKDLELLNQLYPNLSNSMRQRLSDEMIRHVSAGHIVPYKTRIGMSMFMGQPMDSTMAPASIQATQLTPGYAQQQPQGKGRSPSGVKSSPALQKMPSLFQTPGQAREQHHTKE